MSKQVNKTVKPNNSKETTEAKLKRSNSSKEKAETKSEESNSSKETTEVKTNELNNSKENKKIRIDKLMLIMTRVNKPMLIVTGANLLFTILLISFVMSLHLVPTKFVVLLTFILLIFDIAVLFLLKRKKIVFKIVGYIISLLLIIISSLGMYYIEKMNHFLEKGFEHPAIISTDYIVVTSINNSVNSMSELDNSTLIYYHKYSRSIDLALEKLEEHNYVDIDNVSNILSIMNDNPNNYLLISKGNYDYLMESTILYNRDSYKIIDEFTVSYEEVKNKEVKDSYTIYLNGVDFTGIMRDFNMLITINTNSKKILLTSILRGYYVDVPAYNTKDTLMCLGSFDSHVSKEALENLFNTQIDYVVNVNTNSLVDVVDTLGGIEFCSDYSFRTTHIVTDSTYDDRYGMKLDVIQGCKIYNGLETLAIARERLNLKNNERGRIDNCKKILLNIAKKTLSTTSLMNFEQVLNSYDNLYTTDMNKKVITNLVKSLIENYSDYEIIEQSLDGTDGTALGHLGTQVVGVTFPDMNQVNQASKKIAEVINRK